MMDNKKDFLSIRSVFLLMSSVTQLRISKESKIYLNKILFDYMFYLLKEIIDIKNHNNRNTVLESDVKLAIDLIES